MPQPTQSLFQALRNRNPQSELFTGAMLPRQLPVLKSGPEDALERMPIWSQALRDKQTRH